MELIQEKKKEFSKFQTISKSYIEISVHKNKLFYRFPSLFYDFLIIRVICSNPPLWANMISSVYFYYSRKVFKDFGDDYLCKSIGQHFLSRDIQNSNFFSLNFFSNLMPTNLNMLCFLMEFGVYCWWNPLFVICL